MKNEAIDRLNKEIEIDLAIKYLKENRNLELKFVADDSDEVPCLIGEDNEGKPLAFVIDLWKADGYSSRNLRLKNVKREIEFFANKKIPTVYLRVRKNDNGANEQFEIAETQISERYDLQ